MPSGVTSPYPQEFRLRVTVLKALNWEEITTMYHFYVLRFDMVEISGKRRKKVPVIITEDVKNGIMVLNRTRDEGGVHKDNNSCLL